MINPQRECGEILSNELPHSAEQIQGKKYEQKGNPDLNYGRFGGPISDWRNMNIAKAEIKTFQSS